MENISVERRVTLSSESLELAGMVVGDEVSIEVEGPGRIVIRRKLMKPMDALGIFDGLYEPEYLSRLRVGE